MSGHGVEAEVLSGIPNSVLVGVRSIGKQVDVKTRRRSIDEKVQFAQDIAKRTENEARSGGTML